MVTIATEEVVRWVDFIQVLSEKARFSDDGEVAADLDDDLDGDLGSGILGAPSATNGFVQIDPRLDALAA
jgi:hypothetical protein